MTMIMHQFKSRECHGRHPNLYQKNVYWTEGTKKYVNSHGILVELSSTDLILIMKCWLVDCNVVEIHLHDDWCTPLKMCQIKGDWSMQNSKVKNAYLVIGWSISHVVRRTKLACNDWLITRNIILVHFVHRWPHSKPSS